MLIPKNISIECSIFVKKHKDKDKVAPEKYDLRAYTSFWGVRAGYLLYPRTAIATGDAAPIPNARKYYKKMEQHTDKDLLAKGVKKMGISLLLMFISPVIIHSSFKNQDHWLYIPILALGLIGAGFAIFMAFRGLKTIMDAIFQK